MRQNIQNINVDGLKPEQIQEIQAMVEAFKAKNKTIDKNQPEFDMIEYLLSNPIEVEYLNFMSREEIYDR